MIRTLSPISMGMAKSTRSYIMTRTGRHNPWVGKWNLGTCPARREGASGKPDLLVDNHDWFGMISGGFSIGLQKMYDRWIPKYRYGRN